MYVAGDGLALMPMRAQEGRPTASGKSEGVPQEGGVGEDQDDAKKGERGADDDASGRERTE